MDPSLCALRGADPLNYDRKFKMKVTNASWHAVLGCAGWRQNRHMSTIPAPWGQVNSSSPQTPVCVLASSPQSNQQELPEEARASITFRRAHT